jgi:hypothetical protein
MKARLRISALSYALHGRATIQRYFAAACWASTTLFAVLPVTSAM